MARVRFGILALLVSLIACTMTHKRTGLGNDEGISHSLADYGVSVSATPPVAARKPHVVDSPHGSREDEYYWLRDDKRENPEMLAYVRAENAYADAMLAHTKALETRVYGEII